MGAQVEEEAEGDGSSDDKEDREETDAAASPIAPPAPLIDTRQLSPNANVEQPVAGAGNPALLGSPVTKESPKGERQ